MKSIIFIGGVGSNPRQARLVGRDLELFYGQPVETLSFREARQSPDRVAQLVNDAFVITHSAGMLVLENTSPRRAIIIAPPIGTHSIVLAGRMVNKTITLFKSAKDIEDRQKRIRDYHGAALREHIQYPSYNSGAIRKIGRFNTIQAGIDLVHSGADVTFGVMTRDALFPSLSMERLQAAKDEGAHIRIITGEHDELLLDVQAVMRAVEG